MRTRKSGSVQIKVVEHRPIRRVLLIGCCVVATVSALVLGFAMGQKRAISERMTGSELRQALTRAQLRLGELESAIVDAELSIEVQQEAAQALRDDLTVMHDKNAELAEELTFYKSLMAPSSLPQGLQIAELVIEPGAQTNEFEYQLLLTQIAKRRGYIAGKVRMDVIGTNAGDEVVLSLTELAQPAKYPLAFRFRYFQDIAGQMTLPPEFVPQQVLVTATQNGESPLQAAFTWDALAGG